MQPNKYEFFIPCWCGCGNGLIITKDDDEVWIHVVESKYYSEQRGIIRRFVEKCRRLWFVLSGKEYSLFELSLVDETLENFKKFVSEL